ncbi:uncharacterized protein LOC142349672 [Convolutriloba macropyga]|uniref:uncharacterized protein LOC142349672 n=1 Tax=Convolutriloba macropyga TaxID=536237 RepID=UPI003F521B02
MRRSSKFGDIAEENEVEKTSNVNNRDSESAKSPDVEEDKLDATGIAGAMGFTSTDIFMSAAKGHLKKLKSIYKQDPTIIYHRDENGFVPLHIAALHSKLDVIKFFIEKEAETTAKNAKTKSEQAPALNPKPALISVRSQHGWTPLLLAISAPKSVRTEALNSMKCIEFLLEKGADPNEANDDGSSACHIATIENVPEVLRLLMKHQADVASLDNNGKKPIDIAREKSHKECARALLAGEWGTSDNYFHGEVAKLMHLKRYRDELRRELDIITLFESDIERTANFKEWLQTKGFQGDDNSKEGPPKLLSSDIAETENVLVTKSDVERTRETVFGRRATNRNKDGGKSTKSHQVIPSVPMSAPPKHSGSICNVCAGPVQLDELNRKDTEKPQQKVEVELPDLRSSFIESVLFGSSVKESRPPATRFFKGSSMLDHQKKRSFSHSRQEFSKSANPYHSDVGSILKEIPPPLSYFDQKPNSKQSNVSAAMNESDTLLNKAAKVPIMWRGKPSTVKEYLLEKSYIC